MRHYFLLLLLCLLSLPTLAQEDYPIANLPATPIFADSRIVSAYPYQFGWLDNETLVFTPFRKDFSSHDESGLYESYSYSLMNNALVAEEASPFFANWNTEARNSVQAGLNPIHRSPYTPDNDYKVVYESPYFVVQGGIWPMNIIMEGEYFYYPDTGSRYGYTSLEPALDGLVSVLWSQDNSAFILELAVPSSVTFRYYKEQGYPITINHHLIDYGDSFLAFSGDGNRLALATHDRFSATETEQAYQQKLIIWNAPRHDDACTCTYDPVSHVIYSEADNEGKNFVGAGFVDEDTIIYIGNEGMYRHSISTGESTLIDAAFNTHWINLAIFSPDNRHVAVTTEQGLYVLPTGFEG
jgi:hypothetical protein